MYIIPIQMNLYNIPQHQDWPKIVNAVVEIPKGTSAKYEYDNELGVFKYDRSLLSAMTYPASYGFIPQTKADDGDALDILVYNSTPILRGTVVECLVLGVLDMNDEGKKDYKILGTPISHVRNYDSLDDIDPLFLEVSKNFFQHYKDLNDKQVEILNWHDHKTARTIVKESGS
jgi:inorganic pyrophosphatase